VKKEIKKENAKKTLREDIKGSGKKALQKPSDERFNSFYIYRRQKKVK